MRALSPALMAAGTEEVGAVGFDSGPVPFTLEISTPSSAAIRRATGDAFTRASSGFSIAGIRFSASGSFFSTFGCGAFFFSFSSAFGSSGFSSFFTSSSFGFSFFFSSSLASGSFSFSSFSFSLGASSPSPPMNAILSPTFTLPPSST